MLSVFLAPPKCRRCWMWAHYHCQAVGVKTETHWQAYGTSLKVLAERSQTRSRQCHRYGQRSTVFTATLLVADGCPCNAIVPLAKITKRCWSFYQDAPSGSNHHDLTSPVSSSYRPLTKVKFDCF